ncbi:MULTISPECIES: ABC transporter ATP-binding protein [unclassified Mesorhizobium]|uniref:ABC transporter ATP-binding protein n=1 Tax=unclassified Mesorhizobium TaxID=325217 RepID=UPI000FD73456|nr:MULTISPECIES: ABC transporter ATP-binding protein [unclassified Mesorhizobium]TGQ37348.1 ABC transporter ATP-binding protein [Mesorhizobium sp. M00.F.Ca.ET.216.01.1.1]TIS56557.1 MAG: ATP-binding cassette domain-containing protein [Mesorhizobium sp.]TIS89185.1 MAG: ATP-binding cassette domain-containing protein [Mesorhizobium sp.]TJW11022.1 MAG: ATP-binding cassette domain-containing protein [Mesorhizobium sp.]TJW46237.1 MAG: ATP-binding cassette domain-containing protein [Mesorhizobium sp.]
MTQPFLSIRKLRKAFGAITAVHDVTLDIPKGEFLTFLGPSGSGKSTTLYAIAGFQDPSSGDVLLQGKSLLAVPSHKRNIGMVFQRYTLFPHLTVADNIAFPLRVRRRPDAEVKRKVADMLAMVRLESFAARLPGALSGGQQQRVALARALAYDPPILLMDEPLSALDKKLREEIQAEIRRIHRETGVTILYVTHDQEEALHLSDRIALFRDGRIEQTGTGEDLYLRPATDFVAGFIGNSNFLAAEHLETIDGAATIRLGDGSVVSGVNVNGTFGKGQRARLMVRPEAFRMERNPTSAELTVEIVDVAFYGERRRIVARTAAGQELDIRPTTAAMETYNSSLPRRQVFFDPAAAFLFPA